MHSLRIPTSWAKMLQLQLFSIHSTYARLRQAIWVIAQTQTVFAFLCHFCGLSLYFSLGHASKKRYMKAGALDSQRTLDSKGGL